MTRNSSDQTDVARRLRNCYQFERNCYALRAANRSTRYRVPRCWDVTPTKRAEGRRVSIWHKLARLCQAREMDPVHYIQWSLSEHPFIMRFPPEPNQLLDPARMDAYKANVPKKGQEIRVKLLIQRREAEAQVSYYRSGGETTKVAWSMTLLNKGLSLSPLFCYCIARVIDNKMFRRIAAHFEERALYQYQLHASLYDEYWKPLIPKGFAEVAAEFYDRLLDQEP